MYKIVKKTLSEFPFRIEFPVSAVPAGKNKCHETVITQHAIQLSKTDKPIRFQITSVIKPIGVLIFVLKNESVNMSENFS